MKDGSKVTLSFTAKTLASAPFRVDLLRRGGGEQLDSKIILAVMVISKLQAGTRWQGAATVIQCSGNESSVLWQRSNKAAVRSPRVCSNSKVGFNISSRWQQLARLLLAVAR